MGRLFIHGGRHKSLTCVDRRRSFRILFCGATMNERKCGVCVWSAVGNGSVPVGPVMRLVHPITSPFAASPFKVMMVSLLCSVSKFWQHLMSYSKVEIFR